MAQVRNPFYVEPPSPDQVLADKYAKVFSDYFRDNNTTELFEAAELKLQILPEDRDAWNNNVAKLVADRLGAEIIP